VSYQAQAQLVDDVWFQARSRSAAIQQAEYFKDDQRADFVALSEALLRGDGETSLAFTRLGAAGPGIADKVDNGDGTISQENVTDADLLSLTQANYPVVAGLYFAADGTPLGAVA
jgi:hypothetical protein